MDAVTIAAQTTALLSPLLPMIVEGGANEVGKLILGDTLTKAKAVWGLLTSAPKGDTVLAKAKQLAATPDDEDARNELDDAITGLLKRNADLLEKVAAALADGKGGNTAIASGAGAVAIGGNANNARINTALEKK
ncbi:hypothetical protein D3877_15765 [Azospirillum cavernae]|uniref:Uncharacterized protein n=1 Tax=Azospirillum cavernae TaxID=2320860 RepID=A0A418VWS4_9PROT|nr:hypothetical protein [Azospirillum cavernae]RJF81592.1 hypothetical protein D3877_15765 [Azospirillum cavernae]